MITGQDQNIFRSVGVNKIDVLGNRIGSPPIYIQIGICFLTWRQYIDSTVFGIQPLASACRNVAVQQDRFILREHTDNINSTVGAVGEWKIDDTVFSAV